MSRLEKVTDAIVINFLRVQRYVDGNFDNIDKDIFVWAKKSDDSRINDILSKASKKKTKNAGYPEYIIFDKANNIVIVIENKKDLSKHKFSSIDDKIDEYAVNGALWYAKHLKQEFDVVAIGISGNSVDNLLIDSYAWKKNAETFSNLNIHEILDIKGYRKLILKKEKNVKSSSELRVLNEKAKEINEFLRNYLGVMEHRRLYVLGSILFALEDPVFKMSYSSFNNNTDLANYLYQTLDRKIKNSGLKRVDIIKSELKPALEGLGGSEKEGVLKEYPNGTLIELIKNVDNILFDYYKNSEIDLISIFFNVFLSYSTSGGSDLGIVLTPSHVTSLFTKLAKVDLNSKILDPCVGTGGFLTAAWKSISLSDKYTFDEKEFFRKNNLFGVEKENSIYPIVALNMFINKDGRSNLYCDDCFSLKDDLRNLECNVGFINPPYSDEIYSEISFIELMLDSLLPNSIGVAIVPVNAVSSRTKKHSKLNEVKRRILEKHKLVASIQMPTQLFYPKGTETIILVFETNRKNEGTTWFAKYDDGFELIKHQNMRTPTANADNKMIELLEAYEGKSETHFSFKKEISFKDQWVYTLHKDYEYEVNDSDLQQTVNDYFAYLVQNRYYKGGK